VQKLIAKKMLAIQWNSSHSPWCAVEAPELVFLAGAEHSRLTQPSCLTTAWAMISYGCCSRACAMCVNEPCAFYLYLTPAGGTLKKDNPVIS